MSTTWCPIREHYFYTSAVIPRWLTDFLRRLRVKETYITAYELIAAACAHLTFPDLLRGRLVHHFVDNKAARGGLVRGSSGKPDCAWVIGEVHVQVLALACQPWFGFVYSEDNLSDLPSRGECRQLEDMLLRRYSVRPHFRVCKLPWFTGVPDFIG